MFDKPASLDTSRTTWKIKARITRMSPYVSYSSDSKNALKGYNLILLDEDNYHIQAFAYADNLKSISKDVKEGGRELFGIVSNYQNPDSPEFSTNVIGVLEDFERSVHISTLPSSKIYLNLNNDFVHSTRFRLEEEGYKAPHKSVSHPRSTSHPDISSRHLIPVYKIVVLAGNSNESFNFILEDKAARRLVGQTATKLLSDGIKDKQSDIYPSGIKKIVGNECMFTVHISDDNLLIQSKIFNVKDAHDINNTTSSESQATPTGASISSYSDQNWDELS
ncbi:hypothetical protein POM88_032508 [Heracleum sosnowskyi]|uniref:Uncharacterized protein n=1 Tax=Heracleum sosnowskyi TaxID=360622 RepID=A0AAD8I2C8_9APIA|nr:hypothetical protein POM88_032508 [Heracleum sosnowskyi]